MKKLFPLMENSLEIFMKKTHGTGLDYSRMSCNTIDPPCDRPE